MNMLCLFIMCMPLTNSVTHESQHSVNCIAILTCISSRVQSSSVQNETENIGSKSTQVHKIQAIIIKAHKAALHGLHFLGSQPDQFTLRAQTAVCLFTPQLWLVLIVPTLESNGHTNLINIKHTSLNINQSINQNAFVQRHMSRTNQSHALVSE